MKGTWREGSFSGDPKTLLSKVLEMGVCFRRGRAFGEHRGALIS
jgi:hypothetical protein